MTIGHYKIDHRFMHDVNKVPKSMRAFGLAPLSPLARFSFYFRSDFFLYREYLRFFATNKFGRSSRERRTGVCVCVFCVEISPAKVSSLIDLQVCFMQHLPTYLLTQTTRLLACICGGDSSCPTAYLIPSTNIYCSLRITLCLNNLLYWAQRF